MGLTKDTWAWEDEPMNDFRTDAASAGAKGNANAEASVPSTPARPADAAPLTPGAVLQAMQDHYWDSLEPHREIVLKHVEGVLRLFQKE